jgi:hypothetical protein
VVSLEHEVGENEARKRDWNGRRKEHDDDTTRIDGSTPFPAQKAGGGKSSGLGEFWKSELA